MKKIFKLFALAAFILSVSTPAIPAEDNPRFTPVVKVIKEWAPSVVNISTERVVLLGAHPSWGNYGNLLDELYKQQSQQSPIGTLKLKSVGSGVVVSEEGLVLTNAHVVNMANKIFATFYDGTQVEASVAAVDQRDDLALIKVALPKGIKPVKLAHDIMIGETVISVGNPFGLENSVTAGIVSGLNRRYTSNDMTVIIDNLIQIDAPVNPGSSGGGLFNIDGEVVGINLAVAQNAQGIGFAIPYTKVRDVLKEYNELKQRPVAVNIPVQ